MYCDLALFTLNTFGDMTSLIFLAGNDRDNICFKIDLLSS